MSVVETTPVPAGRKLGRAARTAVISAGFVAVMIPGQFALVAGLPVALVLISTLSDARLRWWAAGLAALYATSLVLWAVGPNRAPSLSQDMHPVLAVLITAAAVAVIIRFFTGARRPDPGGH